MKKNIKNECTLLVEDILNKKFTSANSKLRFLIDTIQKQREDNINKLLFEAEDDEVADAEIPEDADTELDEAGDTPGLGDDLEGATKGEPDEGVEFEDPNTIDDESSEEDQVGQAKLSEMGNDQAELKCQINEKMISIYDDKLANLKTALNAKGLDREDREYVTLETQISYYSKKLRELQDKCEITVDQNEVEERLSVIDQAIKAIENQMSGDLANDVPEVKSSEELAEDEEAPAEGEEEEVPEEEEEEAAPEEEEEEVPEEEEEVEEEEEEAPEK